MRSSRRKRNRFARVKSVAVAGLILALGLEGGAALAAPKKAARAPSKATPRAEASSEAAAPSDAKASRTGESAAAPAPDASAAVPTTTADGRPIDPELGAPPTAADTDPKLRPSPLTPRPEEMPTRDGTSPDYAALLGELVALRARVTALTGALYDSKLRVTLETDGDDTRFASLVVTLDGAVVYSAPERFTGTEEIVVFEHAVAPGTHVLGVETERYDGRSPTSRSWQVARYSVQVPEKKILQAHVLVADDSAMADFAADGSGRYELGARLDVEVLEP